MSKGSGNKKFKKNPPSAHICNPKNYVKNLFVECMLWKQKFSAAEKFAKKENNKKIKKKSDDASFV